MNRDRTKIVLANALLELSNKKLLSDISVQDIISYCNMSRNTFYYHFIDKQELIFWIYSNFHDSRINLSGDQEQNSIELLKYMQKYSPFFKQAFAENGQNCFRSEFIKSMSKDYLFIINNNYNAANLDSQTKEYVANFYAYAAVNALEMIFNNPPEDTDKLIKVYMMILENNLAVAINKLNRKPSEL
jgi:Transcriptional regulator